jgi:hypothetical protein
MVYQSGPPVNHNLMVHSRRHLKQNVKVKLPRIEDATFHIVNNLLSTKLHIQNINFLRKLYIYPRFLRWS